MWFKNIKVSPEQKDINTKVILNLLIQEHIIEDISNDKKYTFTTEALNNLVGLMNIGRIKFDMIYHIEKEILSPSIYHYFLLENSKSSYCVNLFILIEQNLKELAFWDSLNCERGTIICFIRANYYYNHLLENYMDSKYYKKEQIEQELTAYMYLKDSMEYRKLGAHFKKCMKRKCRVCGKNVVNLFNLQIEKVKAEIRNREEFLIFQNKVRNIPYFEDTVKHQLEKLSGLLETLIPVKKGLYGKNVLETLKEIIKLNLKKLIIELISFNYCRNLAQTDKKLYFINEYLKNKDCFDKVLTLRPMLSALDVAIGRTFNVKREIFKEYSASIGRLGKEGEKRIYEGLKKEFPALEIEWKNEEKESGLPYDILITYNSEQQEFIEVKTTQTNAKQFEMSEREFAFALENSDNYKLYLIINLGAGADSYYEIIEDFKNYFDKHGQPIKNIKISSKKLILT
ncbi:MAG: DUF3883 domain-containing protein [Candidatus Thorarchaeota archaeon]